MESDKFPRYHIGESLLPSVRPYLEFIGALDKVKKFGFCPKPGAAVKFTQHKREGYTDFVSLNPDNASWNVSRAEFDDLLLRHAEECGVRVFEETAVTSVDFMDNDTKSRPIAVHYEDKSGEWPISGTISFDYLIDASGRNGVMSTKYLKNRKNNQSLKNIATWGYWKGCERYSPGTSRENAIYVEALQDETGWAWFIPLQDGIVSVGIVQDQTRSVEKKAALRAANPGRTISLQDFYLDQFRLVPEVRRLIGQGELVAVGKDGGPAVKQASDYSYSANGYSGSRFRLVGDAACFIDPFFSSGVHMAFTSGLSAAATIASVIRGQVTEEDAVRWHDNKVGVAYTRFLLVVLGAYKQMRAQQTDVLSDVDEDNFDRAFDLIRPVIQGTADVNKKLTEDEVQQTMDFVKNVFAPTDPEMHAAVQARVDPKFFEDTGTDSVLLPSDLNRIFKDEDTKHVLAEVNARKPIHQMYDAGKNFASEVICGYTIKLERGALCMVRAA